MRRPRLLTIAGSDSGGGAGVQADLKTFAALGGYGMSAVTAVTAQNTREVTAVETLSPEIVAAQIDAVFEDIGVDAVKIGMLADADIVTVVAARIATHASGSGIPVVLDPVMIAKSGARLLGSDAVVTLRDELAPLATLMTPNLPEAEELLGEPIATVDDATNAARRLAGGMGAVLLKGGHGDDAYAEDDPGRVVDLLVTGESERRFVHRRIGTTDTHGTGCTLSAAIAAGLGSGRDLVAAVRDGLDFVHGAIVAATPLGEGRGPVDHLHGWTGPR